MIKQMSEKLSIENALGKLELLVGKRVSKLLNAYGYVLYIEFGTLTTYQETTPGGKKFDRTEGEYSLAIDGIWKFKENNNISLDCITADRNEVDVYLKKLLDLQIKSFTIDHATRATQINFEKGIVLTIEQNNYNTELWSVAKLKTKKWFSFKAN
jgi:hypothetical protein